MMISNKLLMECRIMLAVGVALACLFVAGGSTANAQAMAVREPVPAGIPVRVATYNIENFNAFPGDPQFDAAVAVLQRIGADVVCLQEMVSSSAFVRLAETAGYAYHVLSNPTNALDMQRKPGIISIHPIVAWTVYTSIDLSNDGSARDITRNFIVAEIDIPKASQNLVLICNH